jgi:hypothetical protein
MKRRSTLPGALALGLAIAFVVVALGGTIALWSSSGQDRVCTVTDKDRTSVVRDGSVSSQMRVYTEECDVLEVKDLPFWVWDSASIYNKIQPGETYRFTTYGWRVPLLSGFPVITEVQK